MRSLSFLLTLFLSLTSADMIPSQGQSSDAPYLYYYSGEDAAFIVERADGTDSRILSEYATPERLIWYGPGWSPSGNWFAWTGTGAPIGIGGISGDSAWVVDRNGQNLQRISQLGVAKMTWSPNDDRLLIKLENILSGEASFSLFDATMPEQVTILARYEGFGDSSALWLSNDQILTYHSQQVLTIEIFDSNGTKINLLQIPDRIPFPGRLHWTDVGRAVYVNQDDQLVLVDALTGFRTDFAFDARNVAGRLHIDWNETGDYALIDDETDLWLLSVPDNSLKQLSAIIPPHAPNDFGLQRHSAWRGSKANFVSTDGFFLLDAETGDVATLPIPSPVPGQYDWLTNTLIAGVYGRSFGDFGLTVYNVEQHETVLEMPLEFVSHLANNITLSPDGKYLAFSAYDCQGVCIFNLNTKQIESTITPVNSRSDCAEFVDCSAIIKWHPNSQWLLLATDPVEIAYHISVASIDGAFQRSLGTQLLSAQPVSVGWLPKQTAED